MGDLLATIQSHSNPGVSHKITLGKDGVIYCDCWAWKRNRKCKHLDEYYESISKVDQVTIEMDEDPMLSSDPSLENAVSDAIRDLKGN